MMDGMDMEDGDENQILLESAIAAGAATWGPNDEPVLETVLLQGTSHRARRLKSREQKPHDGSCGVSSPVVLRLQATPSSLQCC